MRTLGIALWGMLITSAVSAAPPPDNLAAQPPAMTETPGELVGALEGKACQGIEVHADAPGGTSAGAQIPIGIEWFRKADGSAWIYFKIGNRPAVPRPVQVTATDLKFAGTYGQVFLLRGNANELAGSTMVAPGQNATVRVTCARPQAVPVTSPQQFDFTSKLNGRSYRIMISIPSLPAASAGYPVLYVLDGNWFFVSMLSAAQVEIEHRRVQPFIVVGIGYPTDDPAEQKRLRNFDLSVPVLGEPRFGGVDAFLQVLDREVKPLVASHVHVDLARQFLYGHSLGGSAALRELFRNATAFSGYIAASPPIGGPQRGILADEDAFAQQVRQGKVHAKVLIISSDHDLSIVPVDKITELACRLAMLAPQQMFVSREIVTDVDHDNVPLVSVGGVIEFAIPTP